MNINNKYKDFEKRIKFNENATKEDNQTLSNIESEVDTLGADLNQALSQINQNSQIIHLLGSPYGNSIADLENFTVMAGEPLYYYGGQAKINIGTKASNGPFGYLFTRVSPASQFSGIIRFYMSQIPAGKVSTSVRFYINEHVSNFNLYFLVNKEYDLEVSFDFFALSASNIFKVEFTDSQLANTILDYIEIITENGRNFMCLNRLKDYVVSSFSISQTSSNTQFLFTEQSSNVGCYEDTTVPITDISTPTVLQVPGKGTPLNLNLFQNHIKQKVSLGYYQSVIMQLSITGENSTLYRTDSNLTQYLQLFDNVLQVAIGYHWRNAVLCYCGTLLNQQLFIGPASLTVNDIPTINSVVFPNEFVTCIPVEDWKIMYRPANKEIGYILLHNSGKIFFLPEDDCSYFIEIGLGTQPNAYMQVDYETIFVYYHFNNIVFRKELKLNSTTNKWELTKNVKCFAGAIEIIELYDGCYLQTYKNGIREII